MEPEISADRITRVRVWTCALPLPYPLRLGPISYVTRDYVVLRIDTAGGLSGRAVGYARNTPLHEATAGLAAQILGEPADPVAVSATLRSRFSPGWAALVRAASLIDGALWDIRARALGVPLAQALAPEAAPRATPVPLMAVAGYFPDRRPEGAVLDEIRRFVDEGYTIMKYMVQGVDAAQDLRALSRAREILPAGVELAADFHGVFHRAEDYARHSAGLADLGLLFAEDPVPAFETREVGRCVGAAGLDIASGEDVITPSAYRELSGHGVRYLRVDATTVGGPALARAGLDPAAPGSVLPHVWPHLHAALAERSEAVRALEVIPDYVGAEPLSRILSEPMPISGGRWSHSTRPGLDLPLDWEAVARTASAHSTLKKE